MIKQIQIKKEKEVLSLVTGLSFSTVPAWYGATMRNLKMDLIIPKNREGHTPCPAIVWVCGGSFMVVDRSTWLPEMMRFARAGYAVASIEYRTSNEARFPAQLIDVKSAIRYLKAHAKELCIDPNHIYIMGESAGGAMASLVGVTSECREFDQGDYLEYDSTVRGVVDFYGLTDVNHVFKSSGENVPYWTLEAFLGVGYTQDMAKAASAVSYVNDNTPPFLILHGTEDIIVPLQQSQIMYDILQKHHIKSDFYVIEGATHGDDLFYQDEMTERILAFLNEIEKEVI